MLSQAQHDRNVYDILSVPGTKGMSQSTNYIKSKSKKVGKRKSSRSSTSRQLNDIQPKKSFTRLKKHDGEKQFLSQHSRQFKSFNNGAMKFKKHVPQSDKAYKTKGYDRDVINMMSEESHGRNTKESILTNPMSKNLIMNLNHQVSFPRNYQSQHKIPGSTKAMHLNLFGSSGSKPKPNKRKLSSKTKPHKSHKKTYSRSKQGNLGAKQMSSGKQAKLGEVPSPYKFAKKGKNVVNHITLSTNEYSNYIKNKHVNSIIFSICADGNKHDAPK